MIASGNGRPSRPLGGLLAHATAALLTLLLVTFLIEGVLSIRGLHWDFTTYYNAGSRVYHGELQNLYRTETVIAGQRPFGHQFEHFDYLGFPLTALVFGPLGAFEPVHAMRIFKLTCAACMAFALLLLYRSVLCARDPRWGSIDGFTLFLGIVLAFAPLWFILAVGGQPTALALLLLVLAFLAYSRGRLWTAALCYTGIVLFKPFFVPSLFVFVVAREWRWALRLGVVFVAEALISAALFGFGLHVEWMQALAEKSQWSSTAPWWNNVSVVGIVGALWFHMRQELHPDGLWLPTIELVTKVASLTLFAWLADATRRFALPTERRKEHLFVLATLLPFFFANVAWPHYLVLLLLPFATAAGWVERRSRGFVAVLVLLLLLSLRVDLFPFAAGFRNASLDSFATILAACLYGSGAILFALFLLLFFYRELLRREAQ